MRLWRQEFSLHQGSRLESIRTEWCIRTDKEDQVRGTWNTEIGNPPHLSITCTLRWCWVGRLSRRYSRERTPAYERHLKCQSCFLCQVLCRVMCLHIHYFWKQDLSKLWQNLLIPARPSPPENTSRDYSTSLPLCKWWLVIATRYWFMTHEVQARRNARPVSCFGTGTRYLKCQT